MNQIKLKQDRFRQITDVSDIFIINLEKRKDRYKHMTKQMAQLSIKDYTRFNAIYGEKLREDKLDKIDDTALQQLITGHREHHEELSSFNCVGVFYSHLELLEKVSKMDKNTKSMILEDDIVFHENTINILSSVWGEIPMDYDIIFIGFIPINMDDTNIIRVSQHVARYAHFWSMGAYIITQAGATKILNSFKEEGTIKLQFDAYIRSLIENNKLTSYFIVPPVATFNKIEGVNSDTQHMNRPNLKFIKFNNNINTLLK
jgi:GR25 family glycosyltransferase involved in LPS biosynthesis|tara:strand:- start:169 stop:945 length:777 start_codon:yes stop_codon:yes gene_type:complete